jgi:drug/metabolite transporter (DMT)-like permease
MNWQIFVAISIVTSAVSALLQKASMRKQKINPVAFAAGFQLLTSFFIGIILLFTGFHLPDLRVIWPNLLLMPVLYSLGNISKFKSLKRIEASEFTILFQSSTVITVLVAVMLLGEVFRIQEIAGLALVILAIVLVTLREKVKVRFSSGELYTLGCAAAFGIAFANDAYILRTFDLWSYTFIAFFIPGALTLLYMRKEAKTLKHLLEKESVIGFVLSSLIYAVAAATVYAAYQIGRNAAQIASITPTYSILIVILAAILLKERDRLPQKLIAAVLAVVGIVLLQ